MSSAVELAKAYVQIVPSAQGIQAALQDALGDQHPQEGERQGQKTGQNFAAKFASVASKAIAAAGLGKALAASLNEGGALQQSLGGVETLFKSSADVVKAYAADAWKSAGLSANDYMQNVSGFAAALRASFDGTEQAVSAAAAESANQAMVDMSDNANKMGTAMESIQAAYQGFAKQNYTLLDNLKLGYGGTKTEMERLLADAQKLTGVKYDIGNLADVYDAIHVIQTELGITGTTALEATTTLSGSFAAVKAAAQNLLGNLALGEDLQPFLDALGESARTWLVGNLLPMVGNVLRGIPTLVSEAVPAFLAQGTELIRSLADGMTQGIPQLLAQALPALVSFTAELRANFGELVSAGIDLILNLANGIVEGLPQLFANIPDIVINIAGLINDNAPKLLAGGVALVIALIRGILQSIPLLIQNAGKITEAVLSVISAVNWVNLGANLLKGIADGVRSMVSGLTDAFKSGFSGALNWIKSLPGQAVQWGKDLVNSFINGLTGKGGAATLAIAGMELVQTAAADAFSGSVGGDMDLIADKAEANALRMENARKAVQQALADSVTRTSNGVGGLSGAAEAASKAAASVVESVSDTVTQTVDGVTTTTETIREILSGGTTQQRKIITTTSQEMVDGMLKDIKTVETIAADGSRTVVTKLTEAERAILNNSSAVRAAMAALGDSFTYTADEAQLQADRLAALQAAEAAAADDVQRLSYLFSESARETGAASEQTQYLSAQLDRARDALESAQKASQDHKKQLDKTAAAQDQFRESAKNALAALDGFGGSLREMGELLGSELVSGLGEALSDMSSGINTVLNFAASVSALVETVTALKEALSALKAAGGVSSLLSGMGSMLNISTGAIAAGAAGSAGVTAAAGAAGAAAGGTGILATIAEVFSGPVGWALLAAGVIGAIGIGIAAASKKAESTAKAVSDSISYRDIQDAYWYGNERAFAGYDFRTDPYTFREQPSALSQYQQQMQTQLAALTAVVQEYLPQAANMQMVLDDGTLVGALTPGINTQMGQLAALAERGN